jgi:1,2-diacylglycerol 3-alpha-glucosyltransferase
MNIAIFTDTYFPQVSGVATSIQTLKETFEENGHNVYIFTTSDPKVTGVEHNVFRYESVPFIFFKDRRVAVPFFGAIYRKCRELKIDVVHTQTEFSMGLMGVSVSKYMRIPLIHTYHTWYEKYLHYLLNGKLISRKTVVQLSKIFCDQADLVISPSKQMKEVLVDYQIRKPIHVLATGVKVPKKIDSDTLASVRERWGIHPDEYLLLSINRIAEEKNLIAIIKQLPSVLTHIPNVKLMLAGDGPQLEELKELTAELGLEDKIIFPGFVDHDHVNEFYQAADVYVNLSTSETQGLTFIEAITNHLPVIAMKTPYLASLEETAPFGHLLDEVADFPQAVVKVHQEKDIYDKSLDELIYEVSADAFYEDLYHIYEFMIEEKTENKRSFLSSSMHLSTTFDELYKPLKWLKKYLSALNIRRKGDE